MAYARFTAQCSVYVFADVNGGVECCGCLLGDDPHFYDRDTLIAHMREHIDAGDKVPLFLLARTTYEDSDFDRVRA